MSKGFILRKLIKEEAQNKTTDEKIEKILKELDELIDIRFKIVVKVRNIERLLGQPLSPMANKSIKNIERNLNRIRDEILKRLEE